MEKIISFGIPCYNSAEYMKRCIFSILEGAAYAEDVEIIIVDDGSGDDTAAIADELAEAYPSIVRAIHQKNGGHGSAVMRAISEAHGIYFKNVDSDDWVDTAALGVLLALLREKHADCADLDLVINNYVYEHIEDNTQRIVDYNRVLPVNRTFSWDEIGHFKMWQYLLIHSITYRLEILKRSNIHMPKHTFYVDNIYAYVPFPQCERLYYLNIDLYRYLIGREDQSVNEVQIANRIDHYWRVARIMRDAYHIYDDIASPKLQTYMMSYFTIVMAICSVFSKLTKAPEAMEELNTLWHELKAYDERMYKQARHGVIGLACNLPGRFGRKVTISGYRVARRLVKFN